MMMDQGTNKSRVENMVLRRSSSAQGWDVLPLEILRASERWGGHTGRPSPASRP